MQERTGSSDIKNQTPGVDGYRPNQGKDRPIQEKGVRHGRKNGRKDVRGAVISKKVRFYEVGGTRRWCFLSREKKKVELGRKKGRKDKKQRQKKGVGH